jgi:hypothetical protein
VRDHGDCSSSIENGAQGHEFSNNNTLTKRTGGMEKNKIETWRLGHFVIEEIPGDDSRVMSSDYFSWVDCEKMIHCIESYLKCPPADVSIDDLSRVFGLYHKFLKLFHDAFPKGEK